MVFSSRGVGGQSVDQVLDDRGELFARLGQAVEIVLTLTARRDDPAVSQQGQVMAHGGLTLIQLAGEGADVPLPFREHQDDLQTGRVADLLQEHRRLLDLLEPLLGTLLRFARLGRRRRRAAGCGRHRGYSHVISRAKGRTPLRPSREFEETPSWITSLRIEAGWT